MDHSNSWDDDGVDDHNILIALEEFIQEVEALSWEITRILSGFPQPREGKAWNLDVPLTGPRRSLERFLHWAWTTVSLGRMTSKIQRKETHPTACSTAQIGSAAGKNGNALLFKEVVHVPQTLPLFFNSLEVSASRPTSNPSDILWDSHYGIQKPSSWLNFVWDSNWILRDAPMDVAA